MGDEQRQALARLIAENKEFEAAIMRATSIEEAMRIAGEHGIQASVEDFASRSDAGLSEQELEGAAGGFPSMVCTINPCY